MSDLRRNIEYNVDQSSINKAKQELDKLKKKEIELAKSILESDGASDKQAKALQQVQKEQRNLASVLRVVDTSFGKQEKAVKEATNALDEYEDRLRSVQRGGADISGDLASSFGGLRGAGDAFTGGNLGAAGKGFEIAEAFADIGEFLPRLKAQAETVGNVIQASSSAASKLASSAGGAISGLTGINAGIATVGVTAVPVVAALAAVTFAIYEFNKANEAQRKVVEANVNALIDTNRQIADGLTQDEAVAEIERLKKLREADAESLGFLNEQYEFFLQEFEKLPAGISNVATFLTQQFVGQEQALVDGIKNTEAAITEADASIKLLEEALSDGSLAANDMANAEADLAAERERAAMEAEQAVARANQLQAQMDQIRIDNDIAERNAAELEAAQAQIDRENAQVAEAKHRETLANIAKAGQERIQQIEAELSNLPRERAAKLAEVQQEGNKKIADLQKDYQQRTIEQYEAFQKDMERSTSDAAKAIARLARDIRQSLTDATLENDVAAFLKAQRDGETRLQDAREDASEQQKRAIQDFVEGREKERQAFMEKQAAIQQAIADEQQQVMQAYNERRMALEQQRQAEQQALQERLAQERQRHQEQLANDARRAEQQARLDNIRERQQQEALARQLQEINTKRQAELSALEAVLAKVNQIGTAARNISIPSGGTQSPVFGARDSGGSKGGGSNIFAKFNNIFNNTIGDIASTADVERTMNDNNQKIMGGLNAAVQELRSGRSSYA